MSDTYKDECHELINKYITSSTRFSFDDIEIQSFEYTNFECEINCINRIICKPISMVMKGRVLPTENSIVCLNNASFIQATEEHSQVELSRQETSHELLDIINTKEYGHIKQDYFLHTYEKEIFYNYACPQCTGSGKIACTNCSGTGKKYCSACSGSGRITKTRSRYDNYSKQTVNENYTVSCGGCSGSGKVNCSTCSGSGKVICPTCSGTGTLTTISKLQSFAVPEYTFTFSDEYVPDYIKDALYKAGIPFLGDFGDVAQLDATINAENRHVFAKYHLTIPFARFATPMKQSLVDWVVYGNTPRIFDAGHVLEMLLKVDLENIQHIALSKKRYSPLIANIAHKSVKDFMESEAHQGMLDAHYKGITGQDLREKMNRAFSLEYFENTLKSLQLIAKSVYWWSNIKWLLAMIFIMFSAFVFLPVQLAQNKPMGLNAGKSFYFTPFYDSWILIAALIFSFFLASIVSYYYRHFWFKRCGGKSLANWIKAKNMNKNRWLIFTFIGVAAVSLLFHFFPTWIDHNGLLYGLIEIPTLLKL